MVQHQKELSPDEGVDGPQRVLLVVLVAFDVVAVVVAEVHGEDVICHIGDAVPDDEVGGQPVPEEKENIQRVRAALTQRPLTFHRGLKLGGGR